MTELKRRQNIYVQALSLLKYINRMDDTLDSIGIKLDITDENKIAGKTMQKMNENPKYIICDALGLNLVEETGYCVCKDDEGEEHLYPMSTIVYYPDMKSEQKKVIFSINAYEMWDLLDKAAENLQCALRVWNCFALRDEDAKNWLEENCDVTSWGYLAE